MIIFDQNFFTDSDSLSIPLKCIYKRGKKKKVEMKKSKGKNGLKEKIVIMKLEKASER
jgi:hypothetical protein